MRYCTLVWGILIGFHGFSWVSNHKDFHNLDRLMLKISVLTLQMVK